MKRCSGGRYRRKWRKRVARHTRRGIMEGQEKLMTPSSKKLR
jgi:hypothetical protein